MTDVAPKLGGLVEFYRSPARVAWTPTGTNVPDYPKLAQLWWPNVAAAVTGEKTPQAAMDNLAKEMDRVLARLERAGMKNCAPKLNPEKVRCGLAQRQGGALGQDRREAPRARRFPTISSSPTGRPARFANEYVDLGGGGSPPPFSFQASRMKIVFRCDPAIAQLLPKPMPAREGLPDWLKSMPRTAFSDFHGQDIRTVKQCPPFIDAMSTGFLIPLPCDVMVEEGRFSWDWPLPPLVARRSSALAPQLSRSRPARGLAALSSGPSRHQVQQLLDHRAGGGLVAARHASGQSPRPAVPVLDGRGRIATGSTTSASSFPRSGPMRASPASCPKARRSHIASRFGGRRWRWNSPSFPATRPSALRWSPGRFWRRPESIAAATAARGRARVRGKLRACGPSIPAFAGMTEVRWRRFGFFCKRHATAG